MATINSKEIIDNLIANNGFYEDDARVAQIVEYTNAYGDITYGVTWCNEHERAKRRYEVESEYVRNPKVIWRAE
jgi:hypothetical protein